MRENFVIKKVGEVRQIIEVNLMCVDPLCGKCDLSCDRV
jgi:hypothetical protein